MVRLLVDESIDVSGIGMYSVGVALVAVTAHPDIARYRITNMLHSMSHMTEHNLSL